MNRPLFRRREARDRLNEMAGVQGFQDGGGVSAGMEAEARRRVIPSPVTSGIVSVAPASAVSFLDLVEKARRGETVTFEDYQNFATNENASTRQAQEVLSMVESPGYVPDEASMRLALSPDLARSPDIRSDPRASYGRQGIINLFSDVFGGTTRGEAAARQQAAEAEQRAYDEYIRQGGSEADLRRMREGEEDMFQNLERAASAQGMSGMEAEARLSRLSGPSGMEMEARSRGPMIRPSGMEAEARDSRRSVAPTAASAVTPAPSQAAAQRPAPLPPSDMERDARSRGPLITNPAEVAAGLNAPDPAVRERTVADFMQEYTANAPKYEGGDKRLMHAMIGFAIAAGDSPNAMTNIAQGLQAGAQMFLQDKAAKDEFDRQIQLNAMQYGMQEVGQERALGRQFTNYVAQDNVTYRGKTYGPGESVPVLHSDIINGRMPGGVVTEGTSDALLASDAAIRKSMAEAVQNRTLSGTEYRTAIETLDNAASDYTSARNLMPLLEASLVRAANGEVTGISSALTRKMNETMNAFGLKPPAEYESPEAFESALRQVSVSMVQDLLGESGKTISDADRRLIDGLIGLQQDIMSGVIKDPDILTRKVQELMRTLESKQRSALDTYTTAMEGYGGSFSPSGTPVRSYRAERVFNPEEAAPQVQYRFDDKGRLVIVREGQ